MITNYFKIKKLKKLKVNSFYIKCKKDYQRLNEAGKQKFKNFEIYKNDWQIFNNVYNWNYSSGRSMFLYGIMGFHQNARWHGYHTTDYNSWQYMATQMEWYEWATKYNIKSNTLHRSNSDNTGLGFGYGMLMGAALF